MSAIAGSVALELYRWISGALAARSAQKSTAQLAFETALNSDNIGTVSAYLNDRLGGVDMSTYVENRAIRERVDACLRRITTFLEPATELPDQAAEKADDSTDVSEATTVGRWGVLAEFLEPNADDPPVIQAAMSDLRDGEVWNALARLRRDIDQRLRIAVPGEKPQPAYRLALQLDMPDDIRQQLSRFYRTASAAIHGEDVDLGDALEAVSRVRSVYAFLDHAPESPGRPKQRPAPPKKRAAGKR